MSRHQQVPPESVVRMPTHHLRLPWRELWQYRDLLWMLVRRDFTVFYKQTLLGPLWYVVQPLLTMVVFTLIFHRLAGLSSEGVPPWLFNLVGIVLWGFFREGLVGISETFHRHQALFAKVYFPRLIVPLAQLLTSLIKLAFQSLVLLVLWGVWLAQGGTFAWANLAGGVVALVLLMAVAFGGGLVVASLVVKYRDLRFLIAFGVQLLMFLSAVFYSLDEAVVRLGDAGRWLMFNPVAVAMELGRMAWLNVGGVPATGLLVSSAVAVMLVAVGLIMFNRAEKQFLDTI